MPRTYGKLPLSIRIPSNSFLSTAVRSLPEGDNETFTPDSPVVIAAGVIVEAATPATDVFGFAVRGAQNGTGKVSEIIPMVDGVEFYANFLDSADPSLNNGASGTPKALSAADLGASFQLQKAAILPGSLDGWFVGDIATAAAAKMVSLRSDMIPPNDVEDDAVAGDLDARVTFVVLDAIRSYQ